MIKPNYRFLVAFCLFVIAIFNFSKAENIDKIEFLGNERIPNETILMLSDVSKNQFLDENKINQILKDLYNSNFFENVNINFENNVLKIIVTENPLINKINFEGIKAKKNLELIQENLKLNERSSFNNISLREDLRSIKSTLKDIGYYFANVEVYVEELDDNKININYQIDIGEKAKIKKFHSWVIKYLKTQS